jgi:hypothetical protein
MEVIWSREFFQSKPGSTDTGSINSSKQTNGFNVGSGTWLGDDGACLCFNEDGLSSDADPRFRFSARLEWFPEDDDEDDGTAPGREKSPPKR